MVFQWVFGMGFEKKRELAFKVRAMFTSLIKPIFVSFRKIGTFGLKLQRLKNYNPKISRE